MSKPSATMSSILFAVAAIFFLFILPRADCLVPYPPPRSLWDEIMLIPSDDPFRILEQSPLTLPRAGGTASVLALARADWKETASSHVIILDVPGMKKGDIKIEVEENRVLRISGERKVEEESGDGEKWHRAERRSGKFLRQFRLPGNADLDHIKAHLEDGVVKITVPKFAEDKKKQPKIIDIAQDTSSAGEDVKATKAEM